MSVNMLHAPFRSHICDGGAVRMCHEKDDRHQQRMRGAGCIRVEVRDVGDKG